MSHTSLGGLDTPIDPLRGVGVALEIHNASFAWDMELKAEDLNNINFRADAGMIRLSFFLGGGGVPCFSWP